MLLALLTQVAGTKLQFQKEYTCCLALLCLCSCLWNYYFHRQSIAVTLIFRLPAMSEILRLVTQYFMSSQTLLFLALHAKYLVKNPCKFFRTILFPLEMIENKYINEMLCVELACSW